jgi:hypothetical protein
LRKHSLTVWEINWAHDSSLQYVGNVGHIEYLLTKRKLLSQTEHQFKVLQIGFISKESLGAVRDILKNVLTLL